MNKLVVAAALVATCFTVPTLPANAAPMLTEAESSCLVFPMFKKECWEMGTERARSMTSSVKTTAEMTATKAHLPIWWNCATAPKGSGHLLDC